MTRYERRCRVLLQAFPAPYRSARADEMVGVLLDTSRPAQRWPSWRTAVDLVTAGLRARSRLSTQGRPSIVVIEGLRLAALTGLCVQASFSVAMVSHYSRDGMLFYLPDNAWSVASHAVLAAIWALALVLMVSGRTRPAVVPSLVASTGSVILLVANFHGHPMPSAPWQALTAVQMTMLGLVPTLALAVASTRPFPVVRRSPVWMIAAAGLAVTFSVLGTGVRVGPRGGRQISFPPTGGLVTFLSLACLAALLVLLLGGPFDPRLGVAMIAVSLPVVVGQVGALVTVKATPASPLALAIFALAGAGLVTVGSGLSRRRLHA